MDCVRQGKYASGMLVLASLLILVCTEPIHAADPAPLERVQKIALHGPPDQQLDVPTPVVASRADIWCERAVPSPGRSVPLPTPLLHVLECVWLC